MKDTLRFLRSADFRDSREEINRENRLAIRHLAVAGIPLGVVNVLAQYYATGKLDISLYSMLLLLGYFVALLLIDRFLIPRESRCSTLLLYLAEVPVMLVSILLCTVLDPDHQSTTVMIFLMALPAFILDRFWRMSAYFLGWCLVFLVLCHACKNPTLFRIDAIHLAEFAIGSAAMTFVVVRVRLHSLRNLARSRYLLEHDELTGVRNHRALAAAEHRYVGKPLLLMMGDLDQLTLFNDFYGHDVGDEILVSFARALSEGFGEPHTYRSGGDELLCVAPGLDEAAALQKMADCRDALRRKTYGGKTIHLTCSFGYVTGTPRTGKEFREMIQLADIYAHKANRQGRDQNLGGPFDAEHLRAGIVESNIGHVTAYETNQLTGLPSMSHFFARSDELLSFVADVTRKPVVGFFNLLRFRDFNDRFGYARGDELISYAANLLKQNFDSRHVCYVTGSQFGILCYAGEVEGALRRVDEGLQAFEPGFRIVCKAGFAAYTGTESAISLFDRAKLAHDSIYDRPNVNFRFYDAKLDEELRFAQYIIHHVDEAIEKGWHQVYYQPIVRAVTGRVCNEEALSRWDDPVYGLLLPYKFISTLERARLLYKLNLNVVRQVLRDFTQRRTLGVPVVPVSVNLSRVDFEQCDMLAEITKLVDASGYPRSMLKIEITESAFVEDQALLRREVTRFREAGFEVWMDDFGSEYSTLNLLQELDFDLIKIDMQFMQNFSAGGKNRIIVAQIIDMARRMGITTLVEGIETEEHDRVLRKLGCQKLQGYLFNRPNSMDYIIRRALNGTGLPFEKTEEAPYYEAISAVDLEMPFQNAEQSSAYQANSELPAGVLEVLDGSVRCVRGSERFYTILRQTGLLDADGDPARQSLTTPLPTPLREALARCAEQESLPLGGAQGGYTCYLRYAAHNALTGADAFVATLLPGAESKNP